MHNTVSIPKKIAGHVKAKSKLPPKTLRCVRMINEAAYYRVERREFLTSYELLDWLAAEAEINKHFDEDIVLKLMLRC